MCGDVGVRSGVVYVVVVSTGCLLVGRGGGISKSGLPLFPLSSIPGSLGLAFASCAFCFGCARLAPLDSSSLIALLRFFFFSLVLDFVEPFRLECLAFFFAGWSYIASSVVVVWCECAAVRDDVFVWVLLIPIGSGTRERVLQIVFISSMLVVTLSNLAMTFRSVSGGICAFVLRFWSPVLVWAVSGAVSSRSACWSCCTASAWF